MEVTTNSDARIMDLQKAILLYGDNRGANFASIHDIKDVSDIKTGISNYEIQPGVPATTTAVIKAMEGIWKEAAFNIDLIPESMLSNSPHHIVWWVPAGKRRVFFNNKELGKRSEKVSHPPLLFYAGKGGWHVYALKENKRPNAKTQLFSSPYFNVYDRGNICVGSAAIPDNFQPSSIRKWEEAFFSSEFNHPNAQKLTSHPRGDYALWKELLDGADFPLQYLVKHKLTLGNLLTKIAKELGDNYG